MSVNPDMHVLSVALRESIQIGHGLSVIREPPFIGARNAA
jgi:hypothetical protein